MNQTRRSKNRMGGRFPSVRFAALCVVLALFSLSTSAVARSTSALVWYSTAIHVLGVSDVYTSLAVAPSGEIGVTYYISDSGDLIFAKYDSGGGSGCDAANWSCELVDGSGLEDAGRYSSLAYNSASSPRMSYWNSTVNGLMFASRSGAVWDRTLVASGDPNGGWTSIAINPSDSTWISYNNGTSLHVAQLVSAGGVGCITISWSCLAVGLADSNTATSIRLNSSDSPVVAYASGGLRLATPTSPVGNCGSGAWVCSDIDSTVTPSFLDLELNSSDAPRVAYYDQATTSLNYAELVGAGTGNCGASAGWKCSRIDGAGPGDRGRFASLALDASGRASIAYQNTDAGMLRSARHVGSGGGGCDPGVTDWSCEDVGVSGEWASIGFDSMDLIHIAHGEAAVGPVHTESTESVPEVTSMIVIGVIGVLVPTAATWKLLGKNVWRTGRIWRMSSD